MHSNKYTMIFALAVCVSCSVVLAIAAGALKPAISQNMEFDIHRNILFATGLADSHASMSRDAMEEIYKLRIKGIVVDRTGRLVPGRAPQDLDPKTDTDLMPVYLRQDNGETISYCIPIEGKGLWSTIYGYLALERDAGTVMGVTFYKHGETPGLGGEIDKDWFKQSFKGKKIFDESGNLASITVYKGKIPESKPPEQTLHLVDGISGATLTGKGINQFLLADLQKYEPYLKTIRSGASRS